MSVRTKAPPCSAEPTSADAHPLSRIARPSSIEDVKMLPLPAPSSAPASTIALADPFIVLPSVSVPSSRSPVTCSTRGPRSSLTLEDPTRHVTDAPTTQSSDFDADGSVVVIAARYPCTHTAATSLRAPYGSSTSLPFVHDAIMRSPTYAVADGVDTKVQCSLDDQTSVIVCNPLCHVSRTESPALMLQESRTKDTDGRVTTITVSAPAHRGSTSRTPVSDVYSPAQRTSRPFECDGRVDGFAPHADRTEEQTSCGMASSAHAHAARNSWPSLPSDTGNLLTMSSKWWSNVICLSTKRRVPGPFQSNVHEPSAAAHRVE